MTPSDICFMGADLGFACLHTAGQSVRGICSVQSIMPMIRAVRRLATLPRGLEALDSYAIPLHNLFCLCQSQRRGGGGRYQLSHHASAILPSMAVAEDFRATSQTALSYAYDFIPLPAGSMQAQNGRAMAPRWRPQDCIQPDEIRITCTFLFSFLVIITRLIEALVRSRDSAKPHVRAHAKLAKVL